ncbi:hypothetical protein CLV30_11651 [Haloactinopolyspora alba]|uniref:Sulfotransferase family protein n=1 Tax=Haloactinopolyspora alba TaxID=648780 RepID=A0A2P8DT56_9ACTN|nr:hypothetical protein [Haloactinopolyspora alba]PSL00391.1 hypothetical protein CLV30_11651 [Haloactinopolyspora alba]
MKIVLHIGMPKAGSTALQEGLRSLRDPLAEAGVLYPKSPVIRNKQALLVSGLTSHGRLPRHLRHKYNDDSEKIEQDAQTWLQQLRERITNSSLDTVVLSDESLFRINSESALTTLAERLRPLADTIDVVVYVRQPSDYYLSMAQQTLKASHEIRSVEPINYRATLEGYAKHVADTLHVLPYDRRNWPNGDILRHFFEKFLPNVDVSLDDVPKQPNTSLSAEAMSVVAEYRRLFWSDANQRFTPDTGRLIRALNAADAEVDGSRRPRLHESVRQAVDNASTELLWLRDMHGVVFDELGDYEGVGESVELPPRPERVEDICQVDTERKTALVYRALRELAEPPAK